MVKHLPFDDEDKAEKVRIGSIRQTIRPYDDEVTEGTELLLRAWEGVPYQSKWSFKKKVKAKEVIPIRLYPKDAPKTRVGWIVKFDEEGNKELVSDMEMWEIAIDDNHETLTSLYDTLRECYGEKVYTEKFLIIRW